ncbi:MAG: NAD-dependent epimerase/dehydratase family protein [Bacteroidaceae bacterium]|nr:NAD-dependent epimerase/dehydratase family protein [Bacteroidaceae bacterium]
MSSLLITGASGFVGSHLVETALAAGMKVWAGMRETSSRRWLQDERINFITLSLNDAQKLGKQLSAFRKEHGGWDYVVHVAGATKATNEAEFMRANCEATANLLDALYALDMVPRRFVLMSSLSAAPVGDAQPDTAYGRSKLAAEQRVKDAADKMDCIVLRPTGVYGPREQDYMLMAKSIKRHVDFAVGFKPQYITFIYVKDLCDATMLALTDGRPGAIYPLSDGATYTSRDFSRLLQKELGVRRVMHITAPLWLLKAVCCVGQWWGGITHKMNALNRDKYNILKRRDWRCDISRAVEDFGYKPQYDLARGVAETIRESKL